MAAKHEYSLLEFWVIVLKRSILSWHQVDGIISLFSYVAILWLGIYSFGIAEKFVNDVLKALFSIIAIGYLVVLIIAYTPYRIWKETSEERDSLKDIKEYEKIIDRISEYFDYGNNKILNGLVKDEVDYLKWENDWQRWSEEVSEFLRKNLSLSEKYMFKNNVLFMDHSLPGLPDTDHGRNRSIVANQLQTLRDLIIRHSERVNKWRAENI